MQVLPGLALGFVAMTAVVSHTLACSGEKLVGTLPEVTSLQVITQTTRVQTRCSDTKIFLAPCTVKASGTRITKEQAVDVQAEFVNRDGLMAIANAAIEYFDFDLAVFDGICEVGITGACRVLECACGEAKGEAKGFVAAGGSGARTNCYMFPKEPRCQVDGPVAGMARGTTGETVVAFCFGNSCKGFSFINRGITEERLGFCSESAETIDFCISENDSDNDSDDDSDDDCDDDSDDESDDDSLEPPCDTEIVTNCCSAPARFICRCRTCSSSWRRTESSGKLAFTDRRSRNTCICTDEG